MYPKMDTNSTGSRFGLKLKIAAAVGATLVAVPLLSSTFASADGSYQCPAGSYLSWTNTYDPPATIVDIGNWPITFVGLGTSSGHVQVGDGTPMNNQIIDVIAVAGEAATDAHMCKGTPDETTTTTTVAEETTTTTTTTVAEETTTTTTTTVAEETTTTTVPDGTTTTSIAQSGPTTTVSPELPPTGGANRSVLPALALLTLGLAFVAISRRSEPTS